MKANGRCDYDYTPKLVIMIMITVKVHLMTS